MAEIERMFSDAVLARDPSYILSFGRIGSYKDRRAELSNFLRTVEEMSYDLQHASFETELDRQIFATFTLLGQALYFLLTIRRTFSFVDDIIPAYNRAQKIPAVEQAYVYLTTDLVEEAYKVYVEVPTSLEKNVFIPLFPISQESIKQDIREMYSQTRDKKAQDYLGALLVYNGLLSYSSLGKDNPHSVLVRHLGILESPDN